MIEKKGILLGKVEQKQGDLKETGMLHRVVSRLPRRARAHSDDLPFAHLQRATLHTHHLDHKQEFL